MSSHKPDTSASAWNARAEELADWLMARVLVRTDRYGGYYRDGGQTRKCARPAKGARPDALARADVVRHFRAARPDDVIGSYALTPGEARTGRWVAVDLDAHTEADDPDRNDRYALHLYRKLDGLRFRPLLTNAGGGFYHLWTLLDRDTPGAVLHAFGAWLVADAADFGYQRPPETFPKQARVPDGKFGNWLRAPGRHHTRDEFPAVFDGVVWTRGEPAVAHVLSLTHTSGYAYMASTSGTVAVASLGQSVVAGQSATIGFWNGTGGQALIQAFNGGATSTSLATWLATAFPNMYRAGAGANNLTGRTNAQVAAFYKALYALGGSRVDAEVMATALNVYATTSSLGGTAGQAYGFTVSLSGLGARSVNVGSNGAAFGLPNNTTRNVYQLLKSVNAQAAGGFLYNGSNSLLGKAKKVFGDINAAGGIS